MSRPKTTPLGWVGWEYDDGIQSVHTAQPSEYHKTIRYVPTELVDRYEEALTAARKAGEELLAAWAVARERRNPGYKP